MLSEHIGYLSDSRKLALYERAVRQIVGPGHHVADLGCGTGILGLLCLRAGATHVLAIDQTDIIDIARTSFERAGLGEQCTFVRANTLRAAVAEPVDVVICDHIGYLGFDYGIVPMLRDARSRYLKPGGHIIPSRLRLSLGAVQSTACHKLVEQWNMPPVPAEYHWLRERMVNAKHAVDLDRDNIIAGPAVLGDMNMGEEAAEFLSWPVELTAKSAGTVHGIAGWFAAELADGIWMTNSPLTDEAIGRPQAFLPIETPVEVRAGDLIKATLMARIAENMLAWVVEFPATGQRFSHATWQAGPSTPDALQRANPARLPRLGPLGRVRLTILSECAAGRTAREIEAGVLAAHPELFPTQSEIEKFVAQTLVRDAEP